jgi:glycosyltransferase involved in cell wall biosynthesis
MKVLCIFEQCNPLWASVPLVAFNLYKSIRELADVTLVTHARNRAGLEPVRSSHTIIYIDESPVIRRYYRLSSGLASRGGVVWPLKHAVTYPAYAEFNRRVLDGFGPAVARGAYDIVHAFTPVLPRYPFAIARQCRITPFILGPVNGGIPYPAAFQHIARREFSGLNVLRLFCRMLPGYARSYTSAARVLAGSGYTAGMIRDMFGLSAERLTLFPENGIEEQQFHPAGSGGRSSLLRLLFTGRLVPYKGADMLLDAMAMLPGSVRENCRLTILGDGPERERLQEQADRLALGSCVAFAGWVEQKDTAAYYREADLFCFPSVREFGGAVVLEAMACGLPCIVVDHGGIAEYTTPETGFKIAPVSRDAVVAELAARIAELFHDRDLLERMARAALQQSRTFYWPAKAQRLLDIYTHALQDTRTRTHD